jgi:hypothetical protein
MSQARNNMHGSSLQLPSVGAVAKGVSGIAHLQASILLGKVFVTLSAASMDNFSQLRYVCRSGIGRASQIGQEH